MVRLSPVFGVGGRLRIELPASNQIALGLAEADDKP